MPEFLLLVSRGSARRTAAYGVSCLLTPDVLEATMDLGAHLPLAELDKLDRRQMTTLSWS